MTTKKIWIVFTDIFQNTILHPQYFTFKATNKGVEAAKRHASGVLVDVGCGRMPYRGQIEPLVKKYIAIDSPQTSKLYRGKWKPDYFADATRLPIMTGSVDTVLLFQVLEYLENPDAALSEIHRILRKNGKLLISVPFMYPIHDVPYDLARYTDAMLTKMMKKNGFTIIEFTSEGTFLEFWGQSLNVFLMKRIKDVLKSKKNILTLFYLFFLIMLSVLVIVPINLFTYLIGNIGSISPKYPNYFPLDYIIVLRKSGSNKKV
ncbi:MAG: hypothetical protein RLZZ455_394 [Candidatus Parcubacteria bacterium]|jgi:SAM-dependent methyltransferase